ncbi:nif-specific transcriptional activator NifA [Pseudogemmobacter blasticus]|uniref:Nif-specific regulatory protein n=1 Tax=Fuscovulum blasticum DSM 2131 TaxID=1188250 RepID=A0A2T4J4N4_FUSBL|nr:nif-specific transcriptional activator NifA [Fuscovulum blasticum]PTE12862.1 nif-specific transcriptional activator NifA [Fuscovulum blasticum DSM 2131]
MNDAVRPAAPSARADLSPTHRAAVRAARKEHLALNAVFEVAKVLTSTPDPIAALPGVLNILSSFLGLCHGSLSLLVEPDRPITSGARNPWAVAANSLGLTPKGPSTDYLPEQIAQMVFRTGVPISTWDLAEEFGAEAVPPVLAGQPVRLIAVPLRENARSHLVIGVLCAYRLAGEDGAGWWDRDISVLTMVSSLLEQSLRFRRMVARDRERVIEESRRALAMATAVVPQAPVSIDGIIGDSPAIAEVTARVRKIGPTRAPVLLRGESGTGKELFARAIHALSDRRDKPFVRVNCAALSETLLESELFGHEKGAFTGAMGLKKGRFELADGGTLFLDEIGEISHAFQAKLLRVLQEGELERVGGTRTIKVDFRLVTATNRDLEEAVAHGQFRADLYFRICVVPILLPPLRARPGDIRPLAQVFLDRFNRENGTKLSFAQNAFDTLCSCKFPGNVRELENCVNRAAALSNTDVIGLDVLACQQGSCLSADLWRLQKSDASPIGGLASGLIADPEPPALVTRPAPPVTIAPFAPPSPVPPPTGDSRRKTADMEREELLAAMNQAGWVQAKAARLLGMTPRQIAYAIRKHGIEIRRI